MPYRLRDLTISKVALVPKGANPGAHIVLFKHAPSIPGLPPDSADGRVPAPAPPPAAEAVPVSRALVPFAGPGQTWPVRTPNEASAVVHTLKTSTDVPARTRERIKRRTVALAKAQGEDFVRRLPKSWQVMKVQFTDVQVGYELMEKKEEAWEAISTYMDSLRLAIGQTLFMEDGPMSDIDKSIVQFRDAVATALADISKE